MLKTTFRRELWFLRCFLFTRRGWGQPWGRGGHMWTLKAKAWRVFLPNFDLTSLFLCATHRSHRRRSFLSQKNASFPHISREERREESEVMEAVLLWYVDWTGTTLSILEKKKKSCETPPIWMLAHAKIKLNGGVWRRRSWSRMGGDISRSHLC